MDLKQIIPAIILISIALVTLTIPAASACDPTKENCSVTPTATQSATPGTFISSAPLTGTVQTNGIELSKSSNSAETILSLACLLPDSEILSNALGIAEVCPVAPVQVRAVKVAPTPAPTKVAAVVQPKGDSPQAAMTITDNWQTLGPGGVHWYKIDNGNNFFLDVWLDAHGQSGITFALFAPEQINGLNVNTQPKGRGAPVKADPSHDLWWKGSYATGVWHVLVRNYNSTPVQYKIGSKQATTDRKCVSYWEWLPTGQHVLWTDCGMYTDTSKQP